MADQDNNTIDAEDHRDLEVLAKVLDSQFVIPGTGIRFGVDAMLGLVPVLGDGVTAVISGYLIMKAQRLGAPKGLIVRMLANAGIDFATGSIPVVGDLFDVAWKANVKNVALLKAHIESKK